jgi:hypothetical protein
MSQITVLLSDPFNIALQSTFLPGFLPVQTISSLFLALVVFHAEYGL